MDCDRFAGFCSFFSAPVVFCNGTSAAPGASVVHDAQHMPAAWAAVRVRALILQQRKGGRSNDFALLVS
jgi:hypothetical protein